MKKSLTKFLSPMIALLMLVSILTVCPITASADTNGDFSYSLTLTGGAYIIGYEGKATDLKIPSKIDGHPVVGIGRQAFLACTSLKKVTIPYGVTEIGDYAFKYCSNLTDIIIPDSVTRIKIDAFSQTKWFDNQPNGLIYAGKVLYTYKGNMPENNSSITLKDGTIGIADYAFLECTNLKHIKFPDSVKVIGKSAFNACINLQDVVIPDSVKIIDDYAFLHCLSMNRISIPASVTHLGFQSFGYMWPENGSGIIQNLAIKNFVIRGVKGTVAENYAKENNFKFIEIINGDADVDGVLTVKDATHIQMYLASFVSADEIDLSICDVDVDGEINVKDATRIQMKLAGFA